MTLGSKPIHPILSSQHDDHGAMHYTMEGYGLTKREWLAGQALAALPDIYFNPNSNPANAVRHIMGIVDTLLTELDKPNAVQ